ncbi:hypothetical protein BRD18_05380 [Halobacteriales archaeon SW_7_71_33]|nr:MAG: hypothetical protein BRD18_05380 [Halobacteriales archaeon SW_7_71_33]
MARHKPSSAGRTRHFPRECRTRREATQDAPNGRGRGRGGSARRGDSVRAGGRRRERSRRHATRATEFVGSSNDTVGTTGTVGNVTGWTGNTTDDTDGAVGTTENATVTTVADGASTPNGSESVGETAGETTGTVGDATGEAEVDATTTTTATVDGETASADAGVSTSAGDAVEANASVTETDPLNASVRGIDAETAASDDVTGDTTPVGEVAALTAPPDAGDVSASADVETETGTDTTADADGDSDADAGEDADESADAETEPTSEGEASSAGENGESESGSGSGIDDGLPLAGVPTVPLGGRTGAGAAAVVGGLGVTAAATRAWLAGGASTGGAQAAASAAAERSVGGLRSLLDRLRYFIGLGYSRYDDSDPLAHETRARIHETVREEPGVHLSAVAGATDAPLSTVRHHLDVLADEGLVYDADLRGRRRYFPAAETDPALQAALADEATAAVVEALDRLGPASVGDLAEAVDRDRSTLSYHLDRLEDDGVVERERDGRAVVNRLSPTARTTLSGEVTVTADGSEAETEGVEHVGEGAYVPSDD